MFRMPFWNTTVPPPRFMVLVMSRGRLPPVEVEPLVRTDMVRLVMSSMP